MHFAHLVNLAGVIEDSLRDGGLAGVDVSGDADVADFGQVAGHWKLQRAEVRGFRVRDSGRKIQKPKAAALGCWDSVTGMLRHTKARASDRLDADRQQALVDTSPYCGSIFTLAPCSRASWVSEAYRYI